MPEHSYSKSIEHEEYEANNLNLSENIAETNRTENNTHIFTNRNGNLSSDEMTDVEAEHSFYLNGENDIVYKKYDTDTSEVDSKIEVENTKILPICVDNDRKQLIPTASGYLLDKLKIYVKDEMRDKDEFIDVQINTERTIVSYTASILSDKINSDCKTSKEEQSKLDIEDTTVLAGDVTIVDCETENMTEKVDDYSNLILENSITEDLHNIDCDSKIANTNSDNSNTENIKTKVNLCEDNTHNEESRNELSSDICGGNDISNTSNSKIETVTKYKIINNETIEKNMDTESDQKITIIFNDVASNGNTDCNTINDDALPGKLVCKECNVEFEIFCSTCRMLSRILDSKAPYDVENRAKRTLPRKILTIGNESNPVGVFTVYNIPKGVIFGPLEGLEAGTRRSTWKLKGGRFVVSSDNAKNLNWMQFIRRAKSPTEQNLVCFQFKGRLYYKTKRQIEKGQELLVFYGDAHSRSKNKAVETYLSPKVLREMYKVYACTYCCIGMTSKECLIRHKGVCPFAVDVDPLFVETVHCYHCRMFLNKEEHINYHRDYCKEKHERLWQAQMIPEKIIERRRNQAALEAVNVSGKRKKIKEIPQNKKKCVQCSSGVAHSHSDSS